MAAVTLIIGLAMLASVLFILALPILGVIYAFAVLIFG